MNFLKRINQKLPRIIGIWFDKSESLQESPSFRFQIIKQIWNEPLKD
jgi:hypothetical protein